jgi:WD40 repeat protein
MMIHKEYNLITGDDDGTIKLWDLRTRNSVHEWTENEDFISDFALHSDGNTLLAAGYFFFHHFS